MSNFKLNLPTDIPWERICVTEDMIDTVVCDERLPAKWQTSMAVFKYVPAEEYQSYPTYNITYLKVTATITGYQPLDDEIQGEIDWDGVDISTIPGLTDLLNSYNPCHGAILQVIVGPHGTDHGLQPGEYPFFLDFEPKKRELYEMATDTMEKQSRSIESLNITKSSGNTQSMEVLDVDMGGGGMGASASYAGTGGGFTYTAPNGQWGTKRVNADESLTSRSSDVGQEKRETYSFSTQISQMYHLLDSYHLGTNRVVFFIQPRPHTLEEPSGFVRGPRPVDGIQEFFLIVAQLKDQEEFCVSLRLDTSHITTTPILDYERKTSTSGVVSVSVSVPKFSEDDLIALGFQPGEKVDLYRACFGGCWDVPYIPWTIEKSASETITAPDGFIIESYDNVRNESSHGSSQVFIASDQGSATITAKASGLIYEEAGDVICADCPDWEDGYYGSATRQISLNLRSKKATEQTGEEQVLMITTRGLCCCSSDLAFFPWNEFVVDVLPIPKDLQIPKGGKANKTIGGYSWKAGDNKSEAGHESHDKNGGSCKECAEKDKQSSAELDPRTTIRMANELSNYIKTQTIRSLNNPKVKIKKYAETEFFARQLENTLVQSYKGRKLLARKVADDIPKEILPQLSKHLKKKPEQITRKDLISLRGENLAKITNLKEDQVHRLKLSLLGVKFREGKSKDDKKPGKKGGSKLSK
jgi:hypothetical protein